ncbi:MAG TPA: heavy metal translocating P-type ATPase [Sulfuricaulis sp.]
MSTPAILSTSAKHDPTAKCFHCGLPVPPESDIAVDIDDIRQPMCCHGCAAVAQTIVDGGLSDYYKFRTAEAPTAREIVPEFLRQTAVYDLPAVQESFVQSQGEHEREAALILEGITCPACVWLNERHLVKLPGILSAHINYATHRARIRWDERRIHLSDILQAISRIGYRAHPFDPGRYQQQLEHYRRHLLRRVGVAGVFGMQVMTLSVALYVGDWSGVEDGYRRFFYWVSGLLTLPVLFYSAQPFFQSAWRDLKHFRTGMDVPVSLGITVAFLASLWTTMTGTGTIYYDSVCMFAFFLLSARYFELAAHKRATEASEALVQAAPAAATRLTPGADALHEETVSVAELQAGDCVRIRPGDPVPADAVVLEGHSTVDESLLTGEHQPVTKTSGANLVGGSLNIESPLTARVEKTGPDTILSSILRLLDRASAEKPRMAQLADRLAAWFVAGVLLLAGLVALYWWQHDTALWLPATIAVLVVTCPCALSLATPAAITTATGRLTRLGLLVTRGHALETFARATHFVFDKTGTLTRGRLQLVRTETFSVLESTECIDLAGALERQSEHPIARALMAAATPDAPGATEVMNTPGAGIRGKISNDFYFLGSPAYIAEQTGHIAHSKRLEELRRQGDTLVLLAGRDKLHAAFLFNDELRPGACELISELQRQGKSVRLLTGDHEKAARRVASALNIRELAWDLKPADKLAHLKEMEQQGAVVAMIGDGVNDAPVLAAAPVSIAMGGATAVAAASADMILLSQNLSPLADGLAVARRTLGIIRQNLAWALAYNLIAIPVAAAGFLSPWMAALGMSASSLLVVANALRLSQGTIPKPSFSEAGAQG